MISFGEEKREYIKEAENMQVYMVFSHSEQWQEKRSTLEKKSDMT
jgi:thiamine biosynthesis lipoprotein ApbE